MNIFSMLIEDNFITEKQISIIKRTEKIENWNWKQII